MGAVMPWWTAARTGWVVVVVLFSLKPLRAKTWTAHMELDERAARRASHQRVVRWLISWNIVGQIGLWGMFIAHPDVGAIVTLIGWTAAFIVHCEALDPTGAP